MDDDINLLEGMVAADFEQEINETIVKRINELLKSAFQYGFQLGYNFRDNELSGGMINDQ